MKEERNQAELLLLQEASPQEREVLERIRWSQQKEHTSATINLDKKSPEDAKAISAFCQQLYDFSFVAKCFHNKPENNVRLILQTAPAIRNFFNVGTASVHLSFPRTLQIWG